jgi:hypothetical protein
MFVQTIAIVGSMLVLLTIISTLGGSMNRREKFVEGDDESGDAGMSGEIIRRIGPQAGESSAGEGGGDTSDVTGADDSEQPGAASAQYDEGGSGSESGADAVVESESTESMVPETRGLPVTEEAPLEAFDGDMWAAY